MSRIITVILFCLGFAVFMVMQYGADLVRDIGISGDTLAPHQSARVLDAKCKRYNFIVSVCSIDFDEHLSGTTRATHTLNYLLGGSVAGERVALMHSTAHPAVVTSAVGMDHLANRIFTMLVFLVIFAGTPLIIIVKLATGRLGAGTVAVAPAAAPDPQAIDAEIARQVAARAQQQGAPSTRISSTLAPPASAGAAPAGTFGRRTSFR